MCDIWRIREKREISAADLEPHFFERLCDPSLQLYWMESVQYEQARHQFVPAQLFEDFFPLPFLPARQLQNPLDSGAVLRQSDNKYARAPG